MGSLKPLIQSKVIRKQIAQSRDWRGGHVVCVMVVYTKALAATFKIA